MVTGVTTDATDDAVQANIVAVGYKALPTLQCVEMGTSTCYKDRPNARIMGDVVMSSNGMTRELCMRACFGRPLVCGSSIILLRIPPLIIC